MSLSQGSEAPKPPGESPGILGPRAFWAKYWRAPAGRGPLAARGSCALLTFGRTSSPASITPVNQGQILPQAGTYVIAAMPVITPTAASAGTVLGFVPEQAAGNDRGTFVSYRLPGRIVCLERVCAARHPAASPTQVGWCHGLSMSIRDGDRGQRRGRAVSGAAAAGARLARAGVAPAGRPAVRRGESRRRGRHPARDRRAGRAGEGVAGP